MSIIPTFLAYRTSVGLLPDADPTEVDVAWLRYHQLCDTLVGDVLHAIPDVPAGNVLQEIAISVIDDHLGADWYSSRIEKGDDYLAPGNDPVSRLQAMWRARELARRLYQLQSFDWFENCTAKVRTGDVSSFCFELDVAYHLMTTSPAVAATLEVGVKGADFDLSAVIGSTRVPIEVKTKSERTPLTEKTVTSTVRAAAKQLPKGEQGILFIRVPFAWIGGALEDFYADALSEGTRQTRRIGAVVTAIDKPHLNPDKKNGEVTRVFDYFREPDCNSEIWDFVLLFKAFRDAELPYMAPPVPF
jgi:hypothetical protein